MKRQIRRVHQARQSSMHELNITPLLDLVFVLLVIFIITTPQLTNSLEINLPSGKAPPPDRKAPKPKLNRLYVDEQGHIFLNQEMLSLAIVTDRLKALKQADPQLGVVVEGAEEVDYQKMIDVLDALQRLEITRVGLATEAPLAKKTALDAPLN